MRREPPHNELAAPNPGADPHGDIDVPQQVDEAVDEFEVEAHAVASLPAMPTMPALSIAP
jgi:hypothetical protein